MEKSQRPSELFDHKVYLNEVCDVLAIALAELPALLQPKDVCEALLSVKYGPDIICHIVANQADCYLDGELSYYLHILILFVCKLRHYLKKVLLVFIVYFSCLPSAWERSGCWRRFKWGGHCTSGCHPSPGQNVSCPGS